LKEPERNMALPAEQSQQAIATLEKMIDLLGGRAEVTDISQGEEVVLSIKTETPGRLIGRKGQHLESLELLLNRIIFKKQETTTYIQLDIDGYRRKGGIKEKRDDGAGGESGGGNGDVRVDAAAGEPRQGRGRNRAWEPRAERGEESDGDAGGSFPEQERLAVDAAKEVRRWGEPKTMGPYPARERRAIHQALKAVPEVEAESGPDLGGNRKTITIRLASAPRSDASPAAANEESKQ